MVQKEWKRWLFEKYFDGYPERLDNLLDGQDKKIILDAGCGSAGSALLLLGDKLKEHEYIGVDISEAVLVAKQRFDERGISSIFVQCDLNSIPEQYGPFDLIFRKAFSITPIVLKIQF